MSRIGKIARLPSAVREGVNRRLFDGEKSEPILAWLNGLPEVQAVMAKAFGGKPVRAQNLSEWRRGGYGEWLEHQEAREALRDLTKLGVTLGDMGKGAPLSDHLATILTVDFAQAARKRLAETDDPERQWKRMSGVLKHLEGLRRRDHEAMQLDVARRKASVKEAVMQREMEVLRMLEEKTRAEGDPG